VTKLQNFSNTIQSNTANTNTVNGIVLNLTDSNLGSYANNLAGATITNNTLRNLVSSAATAVGLQITANGSAGFLADNGGNPLLLDLKSTSTDDTNGINQNSFTGVRGQSIAITTGATGREKTLDAAITNNTIQQSSLSTAAMALTFTDKPSNALYDSSDDLLVVDNT